MDFLWLLLYLAIKGWWVILGLLSLMLLAWAYSDY